MIINASSDIALQQWMQFMAVFGEELFRMTAMGIEGGEA